MEWNFIQLNEMDLSRATLGSVFAMNFIPVEYFISEVHVNKKLILSNRLFYFPDPRSIERNRHSAIPRDCISNVSFII